MIETTTAQIELDKTAELIVGTYIPSLLCYQVVGSHIAH